MWNDFDDALAAGLHRADPATLRRECDGEIARAWADAGILVPLDGWRYEVADVQSFCTEYNLRVVRDQGAPDEWGIVRVPFRDVVLRVRTRRDAEELPYAIARFVERWL